MLNDVRLTRRRVLALGSAVAATALLAACGEADEDSGGNDADGGNGGDGGSGGQGQGADPTATPQPQPTSVFPTDGEEAVVKIEYEGGLMAVEDIVRRSAINSLHRDGRLFYSGPIPEIFPQPAAPNLLVTTLSATGMEAVGQKIIETGLFEDGDRIFASVNTLVADAPYTVFKVRLAGQELVRVSVYALDFDADASGMPEEEIEARRKLRDLFNYITSAPTGFPTDHIEQAERSYTPERLQLVTYPWDEVGYDFEVPPQTLAWPLTTSPLTIGEPFNLPSHDARSAVIEGADLAAMLAALAEANVLTRWEHGDEAAYLINRPLLPGEEPFESQFEPDGGDQTGGEISHPTGEDELVLRYIISGGFVPMEYHVTNMPVASLYGGGRMFTQGAQIMIYPPPALPPLNVEILTPEGIQMILQEADGAGLLQGKQEWTELSQSLTDAGTGYLTIHANGEVHQISVYAPGMGAMDDLGDMISPEEVEFRERFEAFVGKLTTLGEWLPEEVFLPVPAEYPADRLQIVSQPADVRNSPDDVQPNELDWPLATPLAETGEPYSTLEMARCFVLEGQDFADVMSLMSEATTITRWISNGEAYILLVRPLLPGEEGCQEPL